MKQNLVIRTAGKADLHCIHALAHKIWPPTYSPILTPEQIDYMLGEMYSIDALLQQLEANHFFLVLECESEPAGYASFSLHADEKKGILHKIYLDPDLQRKGLGNLLISAIETRMKEAGMLSIQLDVNRHNKARYFYEKRGFAVIKEKDTDIGNGFFMNDYVMERSLVDD